MLNREQPFSKVRGHSVVAFSQNGAYFDASGNPASLTDEVPLNQAEGSELRVQRTLADPTAPETPAPPPEGFSLANELEMAGKGSVDELHWSQVQKIVNRAGGHFASKEQGLQYLRALG